MSDVDLEAFALSAFKASVNDHRDEAENLLNQLTGDEVWLIREKASRFYSLAAYVCQTKERR